MHAARAHKGERHVAFRNGVVCVERETLQPKPLNRRIPERENGTVGAFLLAPLLPEEVVYVRPPKGYGNRPGLKGKILASFGEQQSVWLETSTTQVVR